MDLRPGKRVRRSRPVEKAAIRAVTAVFEDANMIVQSIDGANDIGKDLYVDLTDGRRVTGATIALQVKGGLSYRRRDAYVIPFSVDDKELWATSSVPIYGIVFDPESDSLHWTNLTSFARADTSPESGVVRVSKRTLLTPESLPFFVREVSVYLRAIGSVSLLDLAHSDPNRQISAVADVFGLGRNDARPLLLLRDALHRLEGDALSLAIRVFARVVWHGDLYARPETAIAESVRREVLPALDWSYEEVCRLLAHPNLEEWQRGGLGQDVDAVIGAPSTSGLPALLERAVVEAPREAAWPALCLVVSDAYEEGLGLWERLVPKSRSLAQDPDAWELRDMLVDQGAATLW